MGIGGNLKHWRQVRGLTQPELAERAGIEQSYLSKLENGRSQASEQVRERLASALGIDVETLTKDPSENGRIRRFGIAALAGAALLATGFVVGYLASGYELRKVRNEATRLETVWSLAPAGVELTQVDINAANSTLPARARVVGTHTSRDDVRLYATRLLDSGVLGTRLENMEIFGDAEPAYFIIDISGEPSAPPAPQAK